MFQAIQKYLKTFVDCKIFRFSKKYEKEDKMEKVFTFKINNFKFEVYN